MAQAAASGRPEEECSRIFRIGKSGADPRGRLLLLHRHQREECYRRFVDLRGVHEAREHTAQVMPGDRLAREERFREGDLPLLFRSPTMELGMDVAQLTSRTCATFRPPRPTTRSAAHARNA